MVYDYAVVGSGLSGILLAQQLSCRVSSKVLLLEKSRGVGGRLSRFNNMNLSLDKIKYDPMLEETFGPPDKSGFYSQKPLNSYLRNILLRTDKIDFKNEVRVLQLLFHNKIWTLTDQHSESYQARWLFLAMPQPQAYSLCHQVFPFNWNKVTYRPALTIFTQKPCEALAKEGKQFYEQENCYQIEKYYQTSCFHFHYWRYALAELEQEAHSADASFYQRGFVGDWLLKGENIPSTLRSVRLIKEVFRDF
jgi:predicted NAD/FAD-dependent oxidoreductase